MLLDGQGGIGPLEVVEHEDVEKLGSRGAGAEGVETFSEMEILQVHGIGR